VAKLQLATLQELRDVSKRVEDLLPHSGSLQRYSEPLRECIQKLAKGEHNSKKSNDAEDLLCTAHGIQI
jgi:hypothetical protein